MGDVAAERMDTFVRLFTSHEVRLRAFAMSLIPHWADAEDVLQQANLILWKKFDQFEIGTEFFAWAARIVYLEAKDFRKRKLRSKIRFGDEFFDAVAAEANEVSGELAERQHVLGECVAKLPEKHRQLLRLRYEHGGSGAQIAGASGRSADAIYNALCRIRKALVDCVNRRLNVGGTS